MTMKKKIASIILILVMCVSVFSGCVLFDTDTAADYARVVASVKNIEIGRDADDKPIYFSKDITKRELYSAKQNYASQLISENEGMTTEQAVNALLNTLINRSIMLSRYEKLVLSGELKVTPAQEAQGYNKMWQAVYSYCDSQITSIESSLYAAKGKTAPAKGAAEGEKKYPESTLMTKAAKDLKEAAEKADIPQKYVPLSSSTPANNDTFKLDAVKRFIIYTIQQVETMSLTKDEKKLLQADKEFVNDVANKTDLYKKIMGNGNLDDAGTAGGGFFCIKKLVAGDQLDQIKNERLQEYYKDKVSVSGQEVQDYYSETLAVQKVSFSKNNASYLNAYYTALKNENGETPFVFYNPSSDVFYVKHILIPFSDAQTAAITEAGKGKTADQQKQFRIQTAGQIESYVHTNGNDDTSLPKRTIQQIYNEVLSTIAGYKNNPDSRHVEDAFNKLIFKYNTDSGIFNNEKGYIMPPKGKGISSGYVPEFENAAYELFEDYNTGEFLPKMVITTYGVHLMMYSSHTDSITNNGEARLTDYTSAMKLQTYADAVEAYLLEKKQANNYELIQSQVVGEYRGDTYIKKHESRYKDLLV